METPVAVVFDERAFRRVIRDELKSLPTPTPDLRTSEAHRPGKSWLTNAEAMDFVGLSRMTLQRYRDAGKLPYSKIGSNVYYRRDDIVALLEAGAVDR